MKAVCWMGKKDMQVQELPDPQILNRGDIIVQVSSTAICGSDLHLYDGHIPTMKEYDVMGHEFMGEVVEVGPDVKKFRIGDRVIIPFPIACGCCHFCKTGFQSACDNSNPNAGQQEAAFTQPGAAIYGYSHIYGGYDGGQAEYARVPFADSNAFKVPTGIPDEKLLFLTDVYPTGFQACDQAMVKPGDVVAIWGGGPVGQFAAASARLMGAAKIIMIDHVEERLALAERYAGAERLHFEDDTEGTNVAEEVKMRTGGRGADICIDAVGMEAYGHGAGAIVDHAKTLLRMQTDRPNAFRQAILAARKGGVVSVPGVYGGIDDGIPLGQAFGKGLFFAMGQTHVHRYLPKLLDYIERGDIDPSFIITHNVGLDQAPQMYEIFHQKQDGCIKVVLKPGEKSVAPRQEEIVNANPARVL
ncbi:glutathione-dependent formaldehyde dehydrogenase [bacterium]|nr:MAG: glutathione-dependent formaldehyde dehydrogenase [bacterium]